MPSYLDPQDTIIFHEDMETEKDKKLYIPEYLNVMRVEYEIVLEY